jgi:hypothetical protein
MQAVLQVEQQQLVQRQRQLEHELLELLPHAAALIAICYLSRSALSLKPNTALLLSCSAQQPRSSLIDIEAEGRSLPVPRLQHFCWRRRACWLSLVAALRWRPPLPAK